MYGLCRHTELGRARPFSEESGFPLCFQLINENTEVADMENAGHPSSETPTATNYFLQYISSRCVSGPDAQPSAPGQPPSLPEGPEGGSRAWTENHPGWGGVGVGACQHVTQHLCAGVCWQAGAEGLWFRLAQRGLEVCRHLSWHAGPSTTGGDRQCLGCGLGCVLAPGLGLLPTLTKHGCDCTHLPVPSSADTPAHSASSLQFRKLDQ